MHKHWEVSLTLLAFVNMQQPLLNCSLCVSAALQVSCVVKKNICSSCVPLIEVRSVCLKAKFCLLILVLSDYLIYPTSGAALQRGYLGSSPDVFCEALTLNFKKSVVINMYQSPTEWQQWHKEAFILSSQPWRRSVPLFFLCCSKAKTDFRNCFHQSRHHDGQPKLKTTKSPAVIKQLMFQVCESYLKGDWCYSAQFANVN